MFSCHELGGVLLMTSCVGPWRNSCVLARHFTRLSVCLLACLRHLSYVSCIWYFDYDILFYVLSVSRSLSLSLFLAFSLPISTFSFCNIFRLAIQPWVLGKGGKKKGKYEKDKNHKKILFNFHLLWIPSSHVTYYTNPQARQGPSSTHLILFICLINEKLSGV